MQNSSEMPDMRSPLPAWIRRFPLLAGGIVMLIALAVLVGWFQDVEALRSISPRVVSMKANTAAALLCLGIALLLAASRARAASATAAPRWPLELAALAIGAVTLVEYAAGLEVGLDQWLVSAPLDEFQTAAPGRMSMLSAICIVLCAGALLLEHRAGQRARAATRALATCAAIVALISLLGYLYGAPLLYRPFTASSAIAPHAAISFLLLSIGIVVLHPQHGLPSIAAGRTLIGTHVRWLLPAAVLIPLVMGILAVQLYQAFGVARLAIAVTAAGTTVMIGLVIALAALSLRRMEDRLEVSNRALAATKQGVFIANGHDPMRPIVYVNEAFTTLTGYSENEALGRRCDFTIQAPPDDPQAPQLAEALARGDNVTVTAPHKRRDGTVFSGRLALSVVPGSDERKHFVGLLEDVTAEQLAAMAKLELLADASQARKDAENANRVKDVFFASITHELRSPLNACTMWLDVLALGPLSEKAAKAVDAIKRNLKIQTRLVNDLIDAAKISSGGIEIHREPHELEQLIAGHIETWQLMAAARKITFTCRLDGGRRVVEADPERLTQVLTNLVENAFANTPAGGHVELHVVDDGDAVKLEVQDTGSGLSAEDIERVFTPFWRSQSGGQSHKGLGLGLAIAEHLVRGHGGTLTARSEGPGKGSVFSVRLPTGSGASRGTAESAQQAH
jgi:PAS domain S-box-containing protein